MRFALRPGLDIVLSNRPTGFDECRKLPSGGLAELGSSDLVKCSWAMACDMPEICGALADAEDSEGIQDSLSGDPT
jgi:hypothetical protein